MMLIDAHAHLMAEPDYVDGLLRTMDREGIAQTCVSGLGELFGMADNQAVLAALRAHPDRLIGAVYVRPGVDGPERIRWGVEHGFRMVKVTCPLAPYHDPSYEPLWEAALEHRLPVLFHTGIVTPLAQGRGRGVSSWNMQPMQVEPITREFPDLAVIVAHLGVNWNRDAAELARMRPNLYVDLTGEPGGWRERLKQRGLRHWLWWPGALDKVVFGTDVHYRKIGQILAEDRAMYRDLGLEPATEEAIFGGTMRRLLGMTTDDK